MKISNKLSLCFIVLICFGCSQNSKKSNIVKQDSIVQKIAADNSAKKENTQQDDIKRAKKWLLLSIARYLKADIGNENDTSIFTKQYLEYKQDAIGRDFDGLTEKEFADKWKSKYNTKFATRNSILIGQQDTVDPKVTQCGLKKENADRSLVFGVVIEDADTENKYVHARDIKIIHSGNTFLIDDILEYD